MRKLFSTILMLGFVSGLVGCASTQQNLPTDTETNSSVLIKSYRIAINDKLTINVWKNPELSLSEPVRPDGKISMPLVGDVMAAGYTPEELAATIEKRLANYVKAPNVTIILTQLSGQEFLSRIRVTGSVAKDVSMSYNQGMTVLDAVLEAGSVDVYADANNTKVHRRTSNGSETYDIYLKDIMEKGDMRTNIQLMPGDIVTVPQSIF
jgi:polysaccharide export outer membrane protein